MQQPYTFTAAIKRDGQKAIEAPGCCTVDGYLARWSNGKALAIFDKYKVVDQSAVKGMTVQEAIEAGHADKLFKFGKQDGYWIWSVEAAAKKKVATAKVVEWYQAKQSSIDDDEPSLRVRLLPYPKEVAEILSTYCRKTQYYYEIQNREKVKAALQQIGWRLAKAGKTGKYA